MKFIHALSLYHGIFGFENEVLVLTVYLRDIQLLYDLMKITVCGVFY